MARVKVLDVFFLIVALGITLLCVPVVRASAEGSAPASAANAGSEGPAFAE